MQEVRTREIVIFTPARASLSIFNLYHMGIGIQLNDYVSPLPSVIRFATLSSTTTRNDGMTGTRPDSMQHENMLK